MRAACVPSGDEPFSNQPLIVSALDSNCWLSKQVAYWPYNEKVGRRVYDALEAEDGLHSAFDDADVGIHLIFAFMRFDKYAKRLCKLLKVSSLEELGVLRHVGSNNDYNNVDGSLLNVCEFRLDVQY